MLRGQLFRTQFVRSNDFPGQRTSVDKTHRIQTDFTDHRLEKIFAVFRRSTEKRKREFYVIGDHHRHGTEENFQVVWQFRSTCVTRILRRRTDQRPVRRMRSETNHRDENGTCRIQFELGIFEDEAFLMASNGSLNQLDLLSNDGQHFQFDAIESNHRTEFSPFSSEDPIGELTRQNTPKRLKRRRRSINATTAQHFT